MSFACLLMTGAALGDRFGRRTVFVIGVAVFTLASIGCGPSDTSAQLITFRTVQGFGAAAVMPLSLTLLSQAVPYTAHPSLVGPMIVAGIGMGFVFAPTAAVVLGSVAKEHAGKASGADTTVREIGGALGIAVLSTVFVTYGSTEGPQQFVDGLHPAVWVGVAVVFFGALCALGIPRRPQPADERV
ncbi:MFS transporter [Streptomyces sp. NPDC058457]|uniref:MFS transporter n=1 Tax=Streptomyces sp. NPDC058457 TaxID=3346507 RepID=UPI0036616941